MHRQRHARELHEHNAVLPSSWLCLGLIPRPQLRYILHHPFPDIPLPKARPSPQDHLINNQDRIYYNQRYCKQSVSPRPLLSSKQGTILLIKVRTLVIKFISLLFMLASPALLAPNAGSATVFDHPTISRIYQGCS